jgi:hypothetical protein
MSRLVRVLSLLLGGLMFAFGFLKFFEPFAGWFLVQIEQSHLPHQAILAGKLTEMLTGILFLLPSCVPGLAPRTRNWVLLAACFLLFTQMAVAIYVHLQPGVPAGVLPLGIKVPVIPGTVLLLDGVIAVAIGRQMRAEKA